METSESERLCTRYFHDEHGLFVEGTETFARFVLAVGNKLLHRSGVSGVGGLKEKEHEEMENRMWRWIVNAYEKCGVENKPDKDNLQQLPLNKVFEQIYILLGGHSYKNKDPMNNQTFGHNILLNGKDYSLEQNKAKEEVKKLKGKLKNQYKSGYKFKIMEGNLMVKTSKFFFTSAWVRKWVIIEFDKKKKTCEVKGRCYFVDDVERSDQISYAQFVPCLSVWTQTQQRR